MKCPHCAVRIGLMSKEMSALGKTKLCPYCGKGVKFGSQFGRFTLVFFLIAGVSIVLGLNSPVAAGVAGGVAAAFSMALKPV